MKIDRKIRVFISSKCGGQYTIGRKVLKAMLEETGFCEVYAFETDYSSSIPVVSAYLNELEESDVIIVFVDNGDGVTDPVQSEINRARELQKKILFIFCDESKREATILQEQIKNGLLEKYYICHEFSDFPIDAYNSFFNDISKWYRFYGPERTPYDEKEEKIGEYEKPELVQLSKNNLKRNRIIKINLEKMYGFYFADEKEQKLDVVDFTLEKLLFVLLGKQNINDIDFSVLDVLWSEVYCNDLKEIIDYRKEAFVRFFNGKYQEAFDILDSVIKQKEKCLPRWLVNDLAIDMRNIHSYILNRNGLWPLNLKGQDILDADEKCLFNPVVDRFNGEFYQEIVDLEVSKVLESPDTVHLGRDEKIFDYLANAFISAVNCLSITHFLLIRRKIISLFSVMSLKYRNHSLFVNVVKMLVLEQDEKILKQYLNKYGEATNHISEKDILDIQCVVDSILDETKRIQSQSLLLEFFAYYYEKDEFQNVINIYIEDAKQAISNGNTCTFQYIFNALLGIELRTATDNIMELLYLFLDSNYTRWYDSVFATIQKMATINRLSRKAQIKLISRIKKCLRDKNILEINQSLLDATQSIRLSLGETACSLDEIVQIKAPKYFDQTYSVNVYEHSNHETLKYIKCKIQSLRNQNLIQGKNGAYSQYAHNEYIILGNILMNTNKEMDFKKIKPIVSVIDETLRTRTQTCEAKFYALRLLILIRMLYPRNRYVKSILLQVENENVVKEGYSVLLQNRYTNQSLSVLWELAKMYILKVESDSFVTAFLSCNISEKIAIMDSLCFFSRSAAIRETGILFKMIWTVLLALESEDSEKIRFLVSVVYSNLYGTLLEERSLKRLIVLLENGTYNMKIGAISRLKARAAKGPKVEYIYQQGRVDNNFCVREVANRV